MAVFVVVVVEDEELEPLSLVVDVEVDDVAPLEDLLGLVEDFDESERESVR